MYVIRPIPGEQENYFFCGRVLTGSRSQTGQNMKMYDFDNERKWSTDLLEKNMMRRLDVPALIAIHAELARREGIPYICDYETLDDMPAR